MARAGARAVPQFSTNVPVARARARIQHKCSSRTRTRTRTQKYIVDTIGKDQGQVAKAINRLIELGLIVKTGVQLSAQYLSYAPSKHDKYDRYDRLCARKSCSASEATDKWMHICRILNIKTMITVYQKKISIKKQKYELLIQTICNYYPKLGGLKIF